MSMTPQQNISGHPGSVPRSPLHPVSSVPPSTMPQSSMPQRPMAEHMIHQQPSTPMMPSSSHQSAPRTPVYDHPLPSTGDTIPDHFLNFLDELSINREHAQDLLENGENWMYVKSDRQIFCVEKGIPYVCEIQ